MTLLERFDDVVKNKLLFITSFIVLSSASFGVFKFLYDFFLRQTGLTMIFEIVLICVFLIFLVISGFIANKMTKQVMKKNLSNGTYVILFTALLLVIPGGMLIKNMNSYQEQHLDHVLSYDMTKFQSLTYDGDGLSEWYTTNVEDAKEFNTFLSQYQVRKMKDNRWDSDVSEEQGFLITIYTEADDPIIATIYEHRLSVVNGDYYEVLNSPVDMDWVNQYE